MDFRHHPSSTPESFTGKPIKKLPEEIPTPSQSTTFDLYSQLAAKTGTSIHRLRITKGNDGNLIPNSTQVSIEQTGLRDQSIVYVKDLGVLPLEYP